MKDDICVNKLQRVKDILLSIVINRKKYRRDYDVDIAYRQLVCLLSLIKPIDKKRFSMFINSDPMTQLFLQFGRTVVDLVNSHKNTIETISCYHLTTDSICQIIDMINCSSSDEELFKCFRYGNQYANGLSALLIRIFLSVEIEGRNCSPVEEEIDMGIIAALQILPRIILDAHFIQMGNEKVRENELEIDTMCDFE